MNRPPSSTKFVLVPKLSGLTEYRDQLGGRTNEVYQIPYGRIDLFHNGITEMAGRFGLLGDLSQNIPILLAVERVTGHVLGRHALKSVLVSNICLVAYYFRSHVLLKEGVFGGAGAGKIRDLLMGVTHPLIEIHNRTYPSNQLAAPQYTSSEIVGLMCEFEYAMAQLCEINLPGCPYPSSSDDAFYEVTLESVFPWVRSGVFSVHEAVFGEVLDILKRIGTGLKGVYVYGSLAKNTIRPISDIDAIIVLDDGLTQGGPKLRSAMACVVDSNVHIKNCLPGGEAIHYLFARELASIPCQFRTDIVSHAVRLAGSHILTPLANPRFDRQVNEYSLINKFQKIRHEAALTLGGGDAPAVEEFMSVLVRHMGKRLADMVYSVNDALDTCDSGSSGDIIKSINADVGSLMDRRPPPFEGIAGLVDIYASVVNECYGI